MQTVEQHVYEALSPYQAPASKRESLYAQLGSYNIRNISRENLEYVINYLMGIIVCLHACSYYRFVSRLGTGQFGKVNKAVWTDGDEETVEVAVKTLTDSANTVKFLQEAAIMAQFKHPNILTLHGVVSAGEPVSSDTLCNIYYQCSLIEDDCVGANAQWRAEISRYRNETNVCILSYKIRFTVLYPQCRSEQPLMQNAPLKLMDFSKQVALGLHYLSCRGFVHRDLAARNILVSQSYVCKVNATCMDVFRVCH